MGRLVLVRASFVWQAHHASLGEVLQAACLLLGRVELALALREVLNGTGWRILVRGLGLGHVTCPVGLVDP